MTDLLNSDGMLVPKLLQRPWMDLLTIYVPNYSQLVKFNQCTPENLRDRRWQQRCLSTCQEHQTSYPIIAQQQLRNIRKLGAGSFADVWLCWYTPADGSSKYKVAAKYVKPAILSSKTELRLFLKEVDTLKHLKHRYIVQLIGVGAPVATAAPQQTGPQTPAPAPPTAGAEQDASAAGEGPFASYLESQVPAAATPQPVPLFLVQEYLPGGALNRLVAADMIKGPWQRHCYSLTDSLRWAQHIAEALGYLHSHEPKVIHRDLKLSNILLTSEAQQQRWLEPLGTTCKDLHALLLDDNQLLLALNSSQIMLSIPPTAHNSKDNSTHSHVGPQGTRGDEGCQPGPAPDQDAHPGTHTRPEVETGVNLHSNDNPPCSCAEEVWVGTPGDFPLRAAAPEAAAASPAGQPKHLGIVPASAEYYLRVQSAKLVYQQSKSIMRLRCLATRTLSAPRLGTAVVSSMTSSTATTHPWAACQIAASSAGLLPDTTAVLHALINQSCTNASRRQGAFGRSFRQQYGQLLWAHLLYPSTVEESVREGTSRDSSAVGSTDASAATAVTAVGAMPAGRGCKNDSASDARSASYSFVVHGIGSLRAALSSISSITARSKSGASSGMSTTSCVAHGHTVTSKPPPGVQPAAAEAGDSLCEAVFQLTARTGSLVYMAPEVFLGKHYNEKADVFSFGIMLYELLHYQLLQLSVGAVASDGQAALHLYAVSMAEEGYRPPINPRLPQSLHDLIRACWAQQPEDRPGMLAVLDTLKCIQQELGHDSSSMTADGEQHSSDGASAVSACCRCFKP